MRHDEAEALFFYGLGSSCGFAISPICPEQGRDRGEERRRTVLLSRCFADNEILLTSVASQK